MTLFFPFPLFPLPSFSPSPLFPLQISDWTTLISLPIEGGALQITEARVIGLRGNDESECFEIDVPKAVFRIECRVARYGVDARLAGLRAFRENIDPETLERGVEIKELPVDMGGIAVVDIGAAHKSMAENEEDHEEWLEDILYDETEEMISIQVWEPTNTKIPVVESGFGDGSYPLYPLRHSGDIVGLEVEFITPDETYSF